MLCSGPSKTSVSLPVPCPLLGDQLLPHPLPIPLRHAGLPAVPPTCQVNSFLSTPCLRPPPPGVARPPPSCHSDPMRHQLLREAARMSAHPPLSLSHPPHKNRSIVKAGPCPPAAQAPTRIGDIETWAVRLGTGDTSRKGVSDLGARLPNLTSRVNGRCS